MGAFPLSRLRVPARGSEFLQATVSLSGWPTRSLLSPCQALTMVSILYIIYTVYIIWLVFSLSVPKRLSCTAYAQCHVRALFPRKCQPMNSVYWLFAGNCTPCRLPTKMLI